MRNLNKLALIVVLGSGFAIAQSMPQQQPAPAPSSTQSQPASPDQQQPSTAPDQGKSPANAPEQLPNTDQKKPDAQTPDQNKLPQSDAAPAAPLRAMSRAPFSPQSRRTRAWQAPT